jgi:tetratricopeptide (TPR) repeat protein
MAVTLPVVVFCCLVLKHMPSILGLRALLTAIKKAFLEHKVVFGILFAIALLYAVDRATLSNPSKINEFHGGSAATNFMTVFAIIAQYFKLMLFPIELNADYSYNAFPIVTSFTDVRFLAGVLIVIIIGAQLIIAFSFDRWITFGGLWIFITLLPVCQIIPHHELMAEHYLYLPILGFSLIVTLLLHHFLSRFSERWIFYSLMGMLIVLAAARTIDRNRDWRDDLTLWRKTTQTAPNAVRAQNNYGKALMQRGRLDEAIKAFKHAIEIKPRYAEAYANLGVAYGAAGMTGQAMQYFQKALDINPRFPEVYFNIGVAKSRRRRYAEAEVAFKKALSMRPYFVSAHFSLAKLYAQTGDLQNAREHFTRVVRIDPESQIARDARLEIERLETE